MTPFDACVAALKQPGPPQTLFKTLDRALADTVGHKLFTLLYVAPNKKRVKRVYTNMPKQYPVGGYKEIGAQHGPFDVSLIQVGAYNDAWPDIHMQPEDGVATHLDVRGGVMVPVHWGTFNLALHDWSEPVDRTWREAKARDVSLAVPRPGERVDVDNPPSVDGWWQAIA